VLGEKYSWEKRSVDDLTRKPEWPRLLYDAPILLPLPSVRCIKTRQEAARDQTLAESIRTATELTNNNLKANLTPTTMGKVENVVFLSLVLDLFAFTIPLPLFPRIIEWYTQRESSDPHGFLSRTLSAVSAIRGWFYNPSNNTQRWDIVLLGGLMGSVFSTLQFIVSPYIGSLSDKYGRKKILLVTMIGNILSALVCVHETLEMRGATLTFFRSRRWIKSTTFASYCL